MRRRKVVPIGFPEERLGELRSALERNGVQVSDGDPNCDAIVVWVDAETRLGEVASIRRARLDLPIVVLAPRDDQDFLDRADGAGATRVLRASGSTDEVAGSLATVLSSGTLARDLKTQTRWTLSQPHPVPVGVWTSGADAPPFRPILVEDDADQRFFMMRAFRKAKVPGPVTVLTSGEELIGHLTESAPNPSLLILDLHLPGQSGLDVLRWVREQPRLKQLPVVLLSSDVDPELCRRAYESGVNCFLVKPTKFNELVELVKGLKYYWGPPP